MAPNAPGGAVKLVFSTPEEGEPSPSPRRSAGHGRIAVIGGGFYGCHIAATLIALGFEVTVIEKAPQLLSAASGSNQFRLHLGFHYARSHVTRMQSRDGFRRFVQHYPTLTDAVPENIYAVARDESLIDFETYRLIMEGSAIPFEEIESASVPITAVTGMMRTEERVLLVNRARRHFQSVLGEHVRTGLAVKAIRDRGSHVEIDGDRFDYVVDATWGHLTKPEAAVFYEPTLMLYYETQDDFPAVTMVDGPLYSLYPTENKTIFTLSSVTETPLGQFSEAASAVARRDAITGDDVQAKRLKMEEQIEKFLPEFRQRFRYVGPQLSLKTKLVGPSDSRGCSVLARGRVISVISGKIDAVFHATESILDHLGVSHPGAMANVARALAG